MHHYPFGLRHFDAPVPTPAYGEAYRYGYTNKELVDEGGLNWNDYGARWYDPALARWGGVDPLAEKYVSWSPYNYVLGNPVKFIDPDGMQVDYGDEKSRKLVARYANETYVNKRGKEKVNKRYNAEFAAKIKRLEESSDLFIFSSDRSNMKGSDSNLGQFNIKDDGSAFNIVINGDADPSLLSQAGGVGAILAEEVAHAEQYLDDRLSVIENGGVHNLSSENANGTIGLEVDAKMFAANSGMANMTDSKSMPGYVIPTIMSAIKSAGQDRLGLPRYLQEVLR